MEYTDNHRKIMLVSDNQSDIRRMERQFMDVGGMECRLYQCATLDRALLQLQKKEPEADVVILDLRLKGAGEPAELYKAMQAGARDIPIVLLTDSGDPGRAQAAPALAAGAQGHVDREQFAGLTNLMRPLLRRRK